ncbi:hypothetical protein JRQ81_006487 [Phrynocephalus forsythii]|uniref:Tyr recombinase domain-containing protein n=1 Tax=Phrynocephalus forsythii TaxID=171643 RepID=A0A9Q0XGS6_9SAUR|nr:hypothetical protein JRQ81_006487 [Phrynocephalus forsythii]
MPLERELYSLDVCRVLAFYTSRTAAVRKTQKLFICYDPGSEGSPVSPQHFSHWIVTTVKLAYKLAKRPLPTAIRAHSTRAIASSAAFLRGIPVEEICNAAMWSTPTTFVKHNRMDARMRSSTTFGKAVHSFVTV